MGGGNWGKGEQGKVESKMGGRRDLVIHNIMGGGGKEEKRERGSRKAEKEGKGR
jgi:hypothetical protein